MTTIDALPCRRVSENSGCGTAISLYYRQDLRHVNNNAMTPRRYFIGAIALAAIAGAFVFFGSGEPEVVFQTARVERGAIVTSVSASGTVVLKKSVDVITPVAGEVLSVEATFNQPVEAGQILAQIDPTSLEARLAMARANLEIAEGAQRIAAGEVESADLQVDSARAQLESSRVAVKQAELVVADAERELQLLQNLSKSGDVARVETQRQRSRHAMAVSSLQLEKARETAASVALDAATVKANVARAHLANAGATVVSRQAELREAMLRVSEASIRSPIAGIVVDRRIEPLQVVAAGTPTFVIAPSLQDIEVRARVDEADVGRVAIGQVVRLGFDAFPGETIAGQIIGIRSLPQDVGGVVTYSTVISVANDDGRLRPGMTAEASIVVATREDALKIPRAALRFSPASVGIDVQPSGAADAEADSVRVWVLARNGALRARAIRTGISDFVSVEVVHGDLAPGEDVVVGATRSNTRRGAGSLRF